MSKFRTEAQAAAGLEHQNIVNVYDVGEENGIYYIFASPEVRSELVSGKRSWKKFTLRFTKSQDFIPFVHKFVGKLETIQLPDGSSFFSLVSDREAEEIETLIQEADVKQSSYS